MPTPGLVSISFRSYSPKEILDAMADAGLYAIEWGSDVHAPCTDPEKLLEIVSLQEKYGIATSSYGTYFRIGKDAISSIIDYIKAAKLLKTDILRLWCGEKGSALYTSSEREKVIAECKELAAIAENEGVTLCLEFHPNTLTDTPDSALDIMQKVDSEHFRMYWQPDQYKTNEYNTEGLKKLVPYVVNIHVFNWDKEQHFPLAGATERWKSYISLLSEKKYALLEFMPDNKIESLKTEADALREILK